MASLHRLLVSHALAAAAGCAVSLDAHAQLRIAAWNISNYQGQSNRDAAIQAAVFGEFQGRSMAPDLFLLQEFSDAAALNRFVALMNAVTGPNTWGSAPFFTGPDSQSVCVYRRSKVQLVGSFIIALGTATTDNQPRHTYRYDVRPVGYSAAQATIGCYNVHLKAGSASSDNARRLIETQRIRDNAQGVDTNGLGTALPAGYQFLIGGDMNTQSPTQSAYVELVGSQSNNTGRFFDPINSGNNGSWNNNATFRFIHTQDPSGNGGMDDRHDQILVCAGLIDGLGLDYIGNASIPYSLATWNDLNHTYRCWGNDGTSYDQALTTTGNTMVGPTIAQALKDCATTAGGHLPVFLDMRVPAEIYAIDEVDFGAVALGATAEQSIMVGNGGDVALWTANGIAGVTYSLAASSGFTAPGGTFADAAGGGLNTHTITMDTSTPGIKTGTVTIASNAPDEPSRIINVTGNVVGMNSPPVANAGPDQELTDTDGSGSESLVLDGSGSTDADGTIVLYRWTIGPTQVAAGPAPTSNVLLPVGVYTVELTVTDNSNESSTDTVTVTIHPRSNQPPTADAGADVTEVDADSDGLAMVMLDGSGSSDTDGTITSWIWTEAGVGQIADTESPTVSLAVGMHEITLEVTDNGGSTAFDTVIVTVLPCVGDYNQDGGIDGADIDAFFTDWESALPGADINMDGGIDGADVEAFFEKWEAGSC